MSASRNIEAFDGRVRLAVYRHFIRTGRAPSPSQAARADSRTVRDARAAFCRLARRHALVLQEGSEKILRAAPFWAVPTRFHVEVGNHSYWGSCIWDALGIPMMLGKDARIVTACGCCDQSLALEIRRGAVKERRGVVHFAVPARHWYDDIVFT